MDDAKRALLEMHANDRAVRRAPMPVCEHCRRRREINAQAVRYALTVTGAALALAALITIVILYLIGLTVPHG